jgi:hypothetical protein
MTTLESRILSDVTRYEQESGRVLPASSFYKSIALDIQRREHCNTKTGLSTLLPTATSPLKMVRN